MAQSTHDLLQRSLVRSALRQWQNLSSLGQHPLVQLQVVQTHHQIRQRSEEIKEMGRSLREVLEQAIESLKPAAKPHKNHRAWRPYHLLHQEYLGREGESVVEQSMEKLAERTLQHEKAKALDKLCTVLYVMEEECCKLPLLATPAGIPFLAPPKPAYNLVGRYHLVETVKQRLLVGGTAALTALNGMPGVGKTAVAIALAHDAEMMSRFQDGILWVGLGRQPDTFALLGLWAAALGIPENELRRQATIQGRAQTIHAAISHKQVLLVIDDAWSLQDALCFKLGGPQCAHLLTTRHLNIARDFAEEHITTLPELSPQAGLVLLARLAPGLSEAEPEAAAELVTAVGGLPLALILMARFARQEPGSHSPPLYHTLKQLRDVSARLKLQMAADPLSSSGTPLSLQASIELSDAALTGPARQAFYALTIFPPKPNTFSLEAGTAVCAASGSVLDELVSAGLVERLENGRFTLHQAIHDYAHLKRPAESSTRFITYFVGYIAAHQGEYSCLDQELENLLTALNLAAQAETAEPFLTALNQVTPFLHRRGLYIQADRLLQQAKPLAAASSNLETYLTLMLHLGQNAQTRGASTQAQTYLQEGIHHALQLVTPASATLCWLYLTLGRVYRFQGLVTEAIPQYHQALEISRTIQDRKLEGQILGNLGTAHLLLGRLDETPLAYFHQALEIAKNLGDDEAAINQCGSLGAFYHGAGCVKKAIYYYQEALQGSRAVHYQQFICVWAGHLGTAYRDAGQFELALSHLQEAITISQERHIEQRESRWLGELGRTYRYLGDYQAALSYLQQALAISQQILSRREEGHWLGHIGTTLREMGRFTEAVEHYHQAMTIGEEVKDKRHVNVWRGHLGVTYRQMGQFELAFAHLTQAVAVCDELRDGSFKGRWLGELGQWYVEQGNHTAAERYLTEAIALLTTAKPFYARQYQEWLAVIQSNAWGT